MPKKPNDTETNPFGIYPDPISRAKAVAVTDPLVDLALAGDMPASRLFSALPTAAERELLTEVRRERSALFNDIPRG